MKNDNDQKYGKPAKYRWKPISQIHEDYGPCVLMKIDDPGYLEIGSNLDLDFDAKRWTHFVPVPALGQEEYEDLMQDK